MEKRTVKELRAFDLPFAGLKVGEHDYHYEIDDTFFQAFEVNDIDGGKVEVGLLLDKRENMLQLFIDADGYVTMPCDRCGDIIQIPVSGNREQIIKFGDGDYEETDEIDVIPDTAWQINVARYIYELISLNIPAKRVHEDISDCNPEALEALNAFQPGRQEEGSDDDDAPIDPRWAALKDLKNKEN